MKKIIYKLFLCLIASISLSSCTAIKSYLGIAEEAGEKIAEDMLKKETEIKKDLSVPIDEKSPSQ